MRKVIRQLIIEQIEKEKMLQEADLMAMTEIFQTLWNLASAGIITYQFAKRIYNAYKSGEKSKEEIKDIVNGFSADFLRGSSDDEDLDHLEKTQPYRMYDSSENKTQTKGFDDETVVGSHGGVHDIEPWELSDILVQDEPNYRGDFDEESTEDEFDPFSLEVTGLERTSEIQRDSLEDTAEIERDEELEDTEFIPSRVSKPKGYTPTDVL